MPSKAGLSRSHPPGSGILKVHMVEEGVSMEYLIPEVEVIGAGSDLVQAFAGPFNDLGAHSLSLGAVCSSLEEE